MGWNQPKDTSRDGHGSHEATGVSLPRSRWFRGVLAALVVLVGAGIAAYFLLSPTGTDKNDTAESRSKKIAKVKPSSAKADSTRDNSASVKTASNRNEVAASLSATNLVSGATNTTETAKPPRPKRIFRNPTESILWHIFSTELGDAPPLVPQIPTKDMANIKKIIENGFTLDADDTEASKRMKMVVENAKAQLKIFLDEGGDAREFVSYYRNELDKAHKERIEALRMLTQFAREDDVEIALQFADKVNEQFKKRGIKGIELPERLIEKLTNKGTQK